jgi:manganese/zinc/iron transport system permease protein
MVLAFIVGPTLTARLLTDDLKTLIGLSGCLGSFASVLGVALARHCLSIYGMPLSTSGLVVCLIALLFIIAVIISPKQGIIFRIMHRKRIKKQTEESCTGV